MPTVADLRARQLDLTRASLRERLLAGGHDHARVVVDALTTEFDIVDVAVAAVSMAHAAVAGDGDDREIPAVVIAPAHERAGRAGEAGRAGKPGRPGHTAGWEGGPKGKYQDKRPRLVKNDGAGAGRIEDEGPMARLFVGAGRKAGIRPGDLVGAITGEAGVTSRSVGAIQIGDNFSLVEVPDTLADEIIAALKATTIRGKKILVRRDQK